MILCIDAPESTTNSRSSGLRVDDAGRHLFSEGWALCFPPSIFKSLLASFHAASRAPCSCHSVSSCERSSNFGALGLRWWGSLGQIMPSEGFWSRILTWRAMAFVNLARWIWFLHVWVLSQDWWQLRRLHILKDATQLLCTWRAAHNRSVALRDVSRSIMQLMLCQHGCCTFVIILFRPFAKLFTNLAMCMRALFRQVCNHSWSCRTSILKGATFHRMNWCKFLWSNPCMVIETFFPLGLLPLGLRVFDAFFSSCCMKEFGHGFGCVIFACLLTSWQKLQLSPSEHFPLTSDCQQSPRILCPRCFAPWFLTTDFLSLFSVSGPKITVSQILASILLFTIVSNLWQSGPAFFWWISILYNSNTVLSFSDSRIFICTIFPRCHQVIFVIDNKIPILFRIEFLNIIISKRNNEQVGIILDGIVGSMCPGSTRSGSDLSSAKETVLFLGFCSSRLTLLVKWENCGWFLFSAETILA